MQNYLHDTKYKKVIQLLGLTYACTKIEAIRFFVSIKNVIRN